MCNSDSAAFLLVHFANSKAAPTSGTVALGGANSEREPESSSSPHISEDTSRSDCSSETTLVHISPPYDSSSDGEEYDASADFDSEDEGNGKAMDEDDISQAGSNSSSSLRKQKGKPRQRTTTDQLRILEAAYSTTKVPNQELRKDLASQLGMTNRRVQIWFQNKRAKEKRLKNQAASRRPGASSAPSETNPLGFNANNSLLQTRSLPEQSAFTPNAISPPARLSALAPPTLTGFFPAPMADPSVYNWTLPTTPVYFPYPMQISPQSLQQPLLNYAAQPWPM